MFSPHHHGGSVLLRRHVQVGRRAAHELRVSWSTPEPDVGAAVQVRSLDGHAWTVDAASTPAARLWCHHASLTGLPSDAAVWYRPLADGRPLADWAVVRTAPTDPRAPVRFTVAGDQGTSPAAAELVDAVLRHRPSFHLHPGDLAYANAAGSPTGTVDHDRWEAWLDLIEPAAAVVPWMPAIGNHDADPVAAADGDATTSFRARFALPTDVPQAPYYTFAWAGVGVVVLDSNDVTYEFPAWAGRTAGAQTRWLAGTLAALRADPGVGVVVVVLHQGVYASNPAHGSDGGVRAEWAALFDAYDVDLVCSGHNHGSERSHPIRGGRVGPPGAGTVYLTAGAGGQCLPGAVAEPARGRAPIWSAPGVWRDEPDRWSAWRDPRNAVSVVDVTPAADGYRIAVSTELLDGTVIDRVAWTARVASERRGVA